MRGLVRGRSYSREDGGGVSSTYDPSEDPKELVVAVLCAKELKREFTNIGKPWPYCKLRFLSSKATKRKTDTAKKTYNPIWAQFFRMEPPRGYADVLQLTIMDNEYLKDKGLGKVRLPLSEFKQRPFIDDWFLLEHPKKQSGASWKGSIHICAAYSHENHLYTDKISDLLQKARESQSLNSTETRSFSPTASSEHVALRLSYEQPQRTYLAPDTGGSAMRRNARSFERDASSPPFLSQSASATPTAHNNNKTKKWQVWSSKASNINKDNNAQNDPIRISSPDEEEEEDGNAIEGKDEATNVRHRQSQESNPQGESHSSPAIVGSEQTNTPSRRRRSGGDLLEERKQERKKAWDRLHKVGGENSDTTSPTLKAIDLEPASNKRRSRNSLKNALLEAGLGHHNPHHRSSSKKPSTDELEIIPSPPQERKSGDGFSASSPSSSRSSTSDVESTKQKKKSKWGLPSIPTFYKKKGDGKELKGLRIEEAQQKSKQEQKEKEYETQKKLSPFSTLRKAQLKKTIRKKTQGLLSHSTSFMVAWVCIFLVLSISVFSNIFLVWGSFIVAAICFALYHSAVEKQRFYRKFFLEYQRTCERGAIERQTSEDLANGVLRKLWSKLAQDTAQAQIPYLQQLLDANLPSTLRNKNIHLSIKSWDVGDIPPVVSYIRVLKTNSPRSILLELEAKLVSDSMKMELDADVRGVHFHVDITDFFFSVPMRIEVTIDSHSVLDWVGSVTVLQPPVLEMEISALSIPMDAMIFPGIKNYIKSVIDMVVNAEAYTFPKMLSLTLGGEFLDDFLPDAGLSPLASFEPDPGQSLLPITDIGIIDENTRAPEGWHVLWKTAKQNKNASLQIPTEDFHPWKYRRAFICYRHEQGKLPITHIGIFQKNKGEVLPDGWVPVNKTISGSILDYSLVEKELDGSGGGSSGGAKEKANLHKKAFYQKGGFVRDKYELMPLLCYKRQSPEKERGARVTAITLAKGKFVPPGYERITKSVTGLFSADLAPHSSKETHICIKKVAV
ncbi:hypothetical protein QOT17_017030 [Balamuthia mandrillaris]